jgi:hypothetical protein
MNSSAGESFNERERQSHAYQEHCAKGTRRGYESERGSWRIARHLQVVFSPNWSRGQTSRLQTSFGGASSDSFASPSGKDNHNG